MIVLAKSIRGQEFFYNAKTAHSVSKRSAEKIRDILNENNYILKPNEIWWIHEVDSYDNAYYYAERQHFTIRNGIVKKIGCR